MRNAALAALLLLALVGPVAAQSGSYEVFVHGVVTNATGQAVKGGEVRLFLNSSGGGTLLQSKPLASNSWQFWLRLGAGEYSIIYIPPVGWSCAADEKEFSLPRDAARFPPPPGTSADLVFVATQAATPTPTRAKSATPRAETLTVLVIDEGHAPVAGVNVGLLWLAWSEDKATDADGMVTFSLWPYQSEPVLIVMRPIGYECVGFDLPPGVRALIMAAPEYYLVTGGTPTPVTPPPQSCQARIGGIAPGSPPITAHLRRLATATPGVQIVTETATFCTLTPTETAVFVPKTGTPTPARRVGLICTHYELFYSDGTTEWIEGECVGGGR